MADLPAFEFFPVEVREYTGEPLLTRSGRSCPNRYRRPAYVDGWLSTRSGGRAHRAVDIMAPQGSLVRAPLGGRVIGSSKTTGATPKGGHHLTIRIPSTGHTLYFSHLRDAPEVGVGDSVRAGDLLGYVGRTGNAIHTCPHLHFAAADRRGAKVNAYEHLVAIDPFRRARSPRPNKSIVHPHSSGMGEHDGHPREDCCCCSSSAGLSGSTAELATEDDHALFDPTSDEVSA